MKCIKLLFVMASGQQGATAVIVAILLPLLFGFAAFAIDVPNLYVARNELQNAADAGALAGAAILYSEDGSSVNTGANDRAREAALENTSQNIPVEVVSVERGHWSFSTEPHFSANNDILAPPDLEQSTEALDIDEAFINALRVHVRRSETPVASFFSRLFGYTGLTAQADAVAYIGFAGTMPADDFDMPFAICKQAIIQSGAFSCITGRMLNSGTGNATNTPNTAGWTDFEQPCDNVGAQTDDLRALVSRACGTDGANAASVMLGQPMGTTGGVKQPVLDDFETCWKGATNEGQPLDTDGDGIPDMPWELRLPVVDCPENNVLSCSEVVGAVKINVLWAVAKKVNNIESATCAEIPCLMHSAKGNWTYPRTETNGQERWNDFVLFHGIQNAEDQPATYENKSVYFLPDCEPHQPSGMTGGENFGILAKRPVLVE